MEKQKSGPSVPFGSGGFEDFYFKNGFASEGMVWGVTPHFLGIFGLTKPNKKSRSLRMVCIC